MAPIRTHTAYYYHGIDPDTLQTVRVSVTHDGQATRYGGGKPSYLFIVPSLREADKEIMAVLHLEHMFVVPVNMSSDAFTKRRVEALEALAAQMREEQRAYQESYAETVD